MRVGECVALAGAVGVVVTMFLEWFSAHAVPAARPAGGGAVNLLSASISKSGWSGVGWFLAILMLVLVLAGLGVALAAALRQTPASCVGAAIFTIAFGGLVVVILALRLLFQPDLGVGASNAAIDVELPALLGLVFAALIPAGAWIALGDDRTEAPESAYAPPPARPVPGT
jgi:hypothetical protein